LHPVTGIGIGTGSSTDRSEAVPAASTDLGHLDPLAVLVGAGDGGLDEGHAGDAVGDARVFERLGDRLAATAADGPFERPVQVGQRLVEALGVAGGQAEVGLDRAGEVAVLGPWR
jgi:hypothetical protein